MLNVNAEVDRKERAVRIWNPEAGGVRDLEARERESLSCESRWNPLSRRVVKWGYTKGHIEEEGILGTGASQTAGGKCK